MNVRKAITRVELTDDETATVLAEALAGRRLSCRAARQLAATLRRVTGALHHRERATWRDSRATSPPRPTSSKLKLPHRLVGAPNRREARHGAVI
jgi:hypothetical protein